MRRAARASGVLTAAAAMAVGAAGCGGSSPRSQRSLDAFLERTPRGRTLAKRFPHRPGSVRCTVVDPAAKRRVRATCSTDVSPGDGDSVLATFTLSWSHGSRARTWFVVLRPDGSVESVRRAGVAG